MRAVVQRVGSAQVEIKGKKHAAINKGLLVLIGVEDADDTEDARWLARKIASLRIFADAEELMNLSINEVAGQVLIISQFTLHAKVKKGSRPSYIRSAHPDKAVPLYEEFIDFMHAEVKGSVRCGLFGANMQVSLVNDGPVTILIDTKNRE